MRLRFIAFPIVAGACITMAGTATATGLQLTAERSIANPNDFDLVDSAHGDLRSMDHCYLPGGADVTASRDFDTAADTVTIRQRGTNKSISITDTVYWGTDRIAMDCDRHKGRWYYGHTVKGTVTAYSASGAQIWQARLEPFYAIPNKRVSSLSEVAGKHVLLALQVRDPYILVEWMEPDVGRYFAVLTTEGALVEQFGPTTLTLRTAGTSEGWELLWGTSPQPGSFIPLELYMLRVAEKPADRNRPMAVIARLKEQAGPDKRIAAKLHASPLLDHAVALLWSPTTKNTLDFCPIVPPDAAKIWLGSDYDPVVAAQAKRLLLSLWTGLEDRYRDTREGPLNGLFQEQSKTDPELARLLASMAPTSSTWDAAFRPRALAILEAATREPRKASAR